MSTRVSPGILLSLVLAALLTAMVVPSPGEAGTPVTIRAARVAGIGNGLDPNNSAWNSATQYTVTLDTVISAAGVPQLLPSSKYRYLKVKAIHDGVTIFFRYQWTDSTANASVGDAPLFADAVAMQIPFRSGYSSIAMGNQNTCWFGQVVDITRCGAVNIHFWRADLPNPQNIVAGGAGTVQRTPDSDGDPNATPPISPLVTHSQSWAGGSWTVILKRPMTGPLLDANGFAPGNLVTLAPNKYYQITFGQWDGGNEERNGVKLVAGSWQTLYVLP